jgi:8-oxo-dGTP pyrophosphatase MutT (NUDIX family)
MAADKRDGAEKKPGRVSVKERRLACSNSKWDVFLDHLVDDRGNEVSDYLVVEGKVSQPGRITGVCVLPIVDGRMVLLEVYRHALGSRLWEAPKGFLDAGETPAEAARRELAEETGLTCAPEHLVPLGSVAAEASTLATRAALFAATRCTGTPRTDEGEIGLGKLQLFDAAAVTALDREGRIEDAATLVALHRFRAWAAEQGAR